MRKIPKCPHCGTPKTEMEFVDVDNRVKRSFVCMDSGCFSDPFTPAPRRFALTHTQLRVAVLIVCLAGVLIWLAIR